MSRILILIISLVWASLLLISWGGAPADSATSAPPKVTFNTDRY